MAEARAPRRCGSCPGGRKLGHTIFGMLEGVQVARALRASNSAQTSEPLLHGFGVAALPFGRWRWRPGFRREEQGAMRRKYHSFCALLDDGEMPLPRRLRSWTAPMGSSEVAEGRTKLGAGEMRTCCMRARPSAMRRTLSSRRATLGVEERQDALCGWRARLRPCSAREGQGRGWAGMPQGAKMGEAPASIQ